MPLLVLVESIKEETMKERFGRQFLIAYLLVVQWG